MGAPTGYSDGRRLVESSPRGKDTSPENVALFAHQRICSRLVIRSLTRSPRLRLAAKIAHEKMAEVLAEAGAL